MSYALSSERVCAAVDRRHRPVGPHCTTLYLEPKSTNSTPTTTRPSGAPKCWWIPPPTPSLKRSCGPSLPVPSRRPVRSPSRAVLFVPKKDRNAVAPKISGPTTSRQLHAAQTESFTPAAAPKRSSLPCGLPGVGKSSSVRNWKPRCPAAWRIRRPLEFRDRIFENFFRVEHHREGDAGVRGSGIGLYIAREVVAAHGVAAESNTEPSSRANDWSCAVRARCPSRQWNRKG